MARGIRKVGENILAPKRAIIVTDKNKSQYKWNEIPDGSLFIDTVTGITSVKLEGESDWVPFGIKNDGTLCIAKDTKLVTEVYTIKDPDEGDGHFSCTNTDGDIRHYTLTEDGYIFELEKGSYQMGRNQMTIIIDDCLHRSEESGGISELSETKVLLKDKLVAGQEVTIMYSNVVHIGNPYPRVFINDNEPDAKAAEIGDLWIDTDFTYAEYQKYLDQDDGKLDWNKIKNTPNSLLGYGIKDNISLNPHTHDYNSLLNLPSTMTANGGRSDKADKLTTPRSINITGEITGSSVFDGSSNININTQINQTLLRNHIISIVGVDDLVAYIRNNTTKVGIVVGTMTATAGAYIPIPSGFARNECRFIIYPLTLRHAGTFNGTISGGYGGVTSQTQVSFSTDLVIDVVNGIIQGANNIGVVGYTAIGVKAGGI